MNSAQQDKLDQTQFEALHTLVNEVAARQLKDFGQINSELKADGTLITSCDRWSDEHIVKGISNITGNQEGVLSEEGSKLIPSTNSYWVVDPLDGTTNFAAGIPFWAISIARFTDGQPETALLDIPALKKRILAIRGRGVWMNNKLINSQPIRTQSDCVSVCSRSISVLQKQPHERFPGKIRLLGVSSLNMTSVATGQTFGALEATPKIWDIAAAWLILNELGCSIKWLDLNPENIERGKDLTSVDFPLIAANSKQNLDRLVPWGNILMN
ncbi:MULTISPECIES: inositol monophosphatase family protein [unclassified Prochlorococcus]|uniref:inositol monophosphatase family protein n=1 Tax=unclassified Prochlorococcus TaxID=2627481 RepID=UPI000533B0C8|nr:MULTISPECIES: inositol monophosphatase family protein [unclassified Prochlorococcus]KGG16842.1 Histidinol-phosphatasee (alternative form) [Prochlorococcus sp. MIT 0602]KGG18184.1 Histidinol-phosphatasee (alternative form) [Prochlorococcus sp. MIT 0603]